MVLEQDQKSKKNVPKPPDGGWGWWVVLASFLIHVVADGVAYTFGLFFVKISEDLQASKASTSWIASIMAGMTYGVGPLAGALVNKFGCRAVSVTGSFIAAFGFSISYFAQAIIFLYFSIGVVGGLGLGLIYLPAIVCVTCYFEKRRSFATGIAVCGSGLGTFCLAPLLEWLIRIYGWREAFVVTGMMIMIVCVGCSCMYRPLLESSDNEVESQASIPTILEPDEEVEVIKPLMNGNRNGNVIGSPKPIKPKSLNLIINDTLTMSCSQPALRLVNESTDSLPRLGKRHSLKTLELGSSFCIGKRNASITPSHAGVILQRKDIFYSGTLIKISTDVYTSNGYLPTQQPEKVVYVETTVEEKGVSEFKKVMQAMMDLSLLKNPIFLFFAMSNFFTSIGYNVPYIYLVDKATPTHGSQTSGYLLSIVGMSNTLSRVMLGYLCDKPWVNRLYLYNSALTICGLATGLCSHTDNIYLLQLYSATFGSTVGVYVSLTSVILVDLLGLEKLTNAFGLLLLFQGIATVIGPPIVGELFDTFGDYRFGFWLAGGMIAISGLMLFFIPLVKTKSKAHFETEGTNQEKGIVITCPGDDEKGRKGSNNNVSNY